MCGVDGCAPNDAFGQIPRFLSTRKNWPGICAPGDATDATIITVPTPVATTICSKLAATPYVGSPSQFRMRIPSSALDATQAYVHTCSCLRDRQSSALSMHALTEAAIVAVRMQQDTCYDCQLPPYLRRVGICSPSESGDSTTVVA